jgi:hypothetical protein
MTPCKVEITGVAGSLQIYGCGTALFLVDDEAGRPVILRVHNCLYGQGQFNLLSVRANTIRLTLIWILPLFSFRMGRRSDRFECHSFWRMVCLHFRGPLFPWIIVVFRRSGKLTSLREGFFIQATIPRCVAGILRSLFRPMRRGDSWSLKIAITIIICSLIAGISWPRRRFHSPDVSTIPL